MKSRWELDPREVSWSGSSSHSGHRTHATRASRATATTGAELKLIHLPTGITVEGDVPRGNYSRGELKQRRDALYLELFRKLEEKVAKHLRIPGRVGSAT